MAPTDRDPYLKPNFIQPYFLKKENPSNPTATLTPISELVKLCYNQEKHEKQNQKNTKP